MPHHRTTYDHLMPSLLFFSLLSQAQLRLAQNQNALRLQREAAAESQTAAALAQKQFKARQYKGDGGLEWREIAEAQEVERAQRIATRASKLAATCK